LGGVYSLILLHVLYTLVSLILYEMVSQLHELANL
jgi:hypothetical protein